MYQRFDNKVEAFSYITYDKYFPDSEFRIILEGRTVNGFEMAI